MDKRQLMFLVQEMAELARHQGALGGKQHATNRNPEAVVLDNSRLSPSKRTEAEQHLKYHHRT